MFCEKCGGLLIPRKDEEDNVLMVCPACGDKRRANQSDSFSVSRRILHNERDETIIIEEEDITLPATDIICPKCENNKAFYQQMQTRSADESMTMFYRCTKCKYTWRDYGG
ncbi:MAG: transcription factor S [Promethearchaeota archaeon]